MNLKKIKEISEQKGISIRKLSNVIEKTEQGLHAAIRNNTLKAIELEKIAIFLQVPISYFFGESETGTNNGIIQNGNHNKANINSLNKEIEYLKQQIKDKNEIINLIKENK